MMPNPRSLKCPQPTCMAIFFAKDDTAVADAIHELVIDTLTTHYFDLMDYIKPSDDSLLMADDLIARQLTWWIWSQKLAPHGVSCLHVREIDDRQYRLSFEHGAELSIKGYSFDDRIVVFEMTKRINCCVNEVAYRKHYEIPNSINDIQIHCEIIDRKDTHIIP